MRLAVCTLACFMVTATSVVAYAETLTEGISTPIDLTTTSSFDQFGLALFDPALGTLNSVTQTLTGSFRFTPTMPGAGQYQISTGPILPNDVEYADADLNFSATAGPQLEEGTDQFGQQYAIEFLDIAVTGGRVTSLGDVTDTYTFNYTPAVTPEPSSLLLFGTGLLGVAFKVRRRFIPPVTQA